MGRCMLDVMARGGFEEKDIASIGVGIPGVADEKTGHVIFCTNLGWSDVPLRTELQKYLNKPVYNRQRRHRGRLCREHLRRERGLPFQRVHDAGHGRGRRHRDRRPAVERLSRRGQRDRPHPPWTSAASPAPAATTAAWSATAAPTAVIRMGQADGVAAPRQPHVRPVRRRREQADGHDGLSTRPRSWTTWP